jgi:hypothetical protein
VWKSWLGAIALTFIARMIFRSVKEIPRQSLDFRLIGKIRSPNRADLGLALSDCCISSKWSFNSVEWKSQESSALDATIIAALDRDSELRHQYLQRRWQGVIS